MRKSNKVMLLGVAIYLIAAVRTFNSNSFDLVILSLSLALVALGFYLHVERKFRILFKKTHNRSN